MKNKIFYLGVLFLLLIIPYKAFSQTTDGSDATLQETLDWLNSKFNTCVTPLKLYHSGWECSYAKENGKTCENDNVTMTVEYTITLSNNSLIITCVSFLSGGDQHCYMEDDEKHICDNEWNDFETLSKFIETREIPFSKIKNIVGWTDGTTTWDNGFYSNQLMLKVTTYGNDIPTKDGGLSNYVFIPFNWSAEQNLYQRMNKAFMHLHQFYPPVVEKF